MKTLYILLSFCLTMAAMSCQKDRRVYHQVYDVTYSQNSDSFYALAVFYSNVQAAEPVLLSAKEAISFNSRPAQQIIENRYFWKGAGKTDVRFLLKKKEKQLITTETASRLGNFELEFPDTISKAKGYTIRIDGLTGHFVHLYIIDPNQMVVDGRVATDIVYVSPGSLKSWREGLMTIRLQESIRGEVMRDGDMSGTFNYNLEYEKQVYYVK